MIIRRTAGRVVEESTVFVAPNVRPRRNKRKGSTTAEKREANEKNCVRALARGMNCNFGYGDLMLTLKYDEAGLARVEDAARLLQAEDGALSWEDALMDAAEALGKKALRRMRPEFAKLGAPLRYFFTTSDRDGKTGEKPVRVHHHLMLPRVAFEAVAKAWELGSVDYQILPDLPDLTPIAVYWCRQVRRREGRKLYTPSRNLKKPVVNERWARPGEELRPDRRGLLLDRNEWEPGRPQYIRFLKDGKGRAAPEEFGGVPEGMTRTDGPELPRTCAMPMGRDRRERADE